MSERSAGQDQSGRRGAAPGPEHELTRLLHDVADAQVEIVGIVEASRREMRGWVERCERAAQEIRQAAEALAKALESRQSGERRNPGEREGAREGHQQRSRRRRVRSLGGGGRELGPAAAGDSNALSAALDGEKGKQDGWLAGELERLVAEAERLLERFSR